MKKYVNGKLYEMTAEDIAKRNARANHRPNARKNTSDYEARVKELENTVAVLLEKLNEKPAEENDSAETE
jgi:uncharacterized protein YceH (UPF0502 family)